MQPGRGQLDRQLEPGLVSAELRHLAGRESPRRRVGKLVSQRPVGHEVWGLDCHNKTGQLRRYMAQLCRRLEDDPARLRHLFTDPYMDHRYRP